MGQIPFSLILISLLVTLPVYHTTAHQECSNLNTVPHQVRAGYWFSHTNRYSPVYNINTSFYTHLYYYSLSLDDVHSQVALPPNDQLPLLATFSATLKAQNPSLKTILSISTDDRHQTNVSSAAFSSMVGNQTLRMSFINSAIELARNHAFDGLDLAWQFPSSSSDMTSLGILLAEWRARINEEAKNSSSTLLLTATAYFSNHLFDGPVDNLDYPIDSISDNLDWANVLCFGYHKNSDLTALDAPLYDKASHFSTSYGITSWLVAGIPACKLVMGVPLYGRSWILKNKMKNELGAPVVAMGPRQKVSNQTGLMAYSEIKETLKDPNIVFVYDNQTVSAYFHSGDLWVSFDSIEVVEVKIEFALQKRLLGYFLWPISFDDSNYTVSKQASEVWLRNHDSPYDEDENGFEQAPSPAQPPSPAQLPSQDHALTPSAAFSGSRTHKLHLDLYILLFLLFYLSTI
ncbi:class V chitinase-like [Phoenix dactylifera]|uniref:Class V chitinase-like n=1 Tax=Phoenix dactylifera TaxID=42345 RepID=A0A8B8ZG98_PHODC|nr:class V chitinase-like [Phoenix dactylifera]